MNQDPSPRAPASFFISAFGFAMLLIFDFMVINLSKQHSLVSNWVAELRDVDIQKDRMRFRRNLERIGELAAIEISTHLEYDEREVQTPLGTATCKVLKTCLTKTLK